MEGSPAAETPEEGSPFACASVAVAVVASAKEAFGSCQEMASSVPPFACASVASAAAVAAVVAAESAQTVMPAPIVLPVVPEQQLCLDCASA